MDSERARCSNLEQALKRERLNVESKEQEVERKSKLLQDISAQERENIEELKTTVLQGKQQLSELEAQLREEKARNAMLETEIGDHRNTSASDKGQCTFFMNIDKARAEYVRCNNSSLFFSRAIHFVHGRHAELV